MSEGRRILWYSDTHLNSAWPWSLRTFVRRVNEMRPDGMFITGDISCGYRIASDLSFLASRISCPIYFVLGNHDYHFRSISGVHAGISRACADHPNLVWMTRAGIVPLSEDVAVVGTEGWYDAAFGDPRFLKLTFDWMLTFDFLRLRWEDILSEWRRMAQEAADVIGERVERALQDYKEVYVLTHFPPWPEADRAHGTIMEKFWLPYNSNFALGRRIEELAKAYKKKRITVLAGHTHSERTIRVRKNVECRVAPAKYTGSPRLDDIFII